MTALKNGKIEVPTPKQNCMNTKESKQPGMIVGDDIAAYFSKIKEGPEAAIRHLVKELVNYVESDEYVIYAKSHSK